jgi:hypothetical protein
MDWLDWSLFLPIFGTGTLMFVAGFWFGYDAGAKVDG